jgi:YcxB-like protein
MEKSFTYDYRSAEALGSRRALNRALYGGGRRWTPSMVLLIPALLYVGFALYSNWTMWLGDLTVFVIVGAGLALLVYIRFAAPRINQRLFARMSGVAALEGRTIAYEFGEDGYHIHTQHFDGFQRWAGVDRIVETKGMVLIVLGPNAHFLPARLFASAGSRREFVAWALQKLGPEARARSRIGKTSRTG